MKKYFLLKLLSFISVFGTIVSKIATTDGCIIILYEPEQPE